MDLRIDDARALTTEIAGFGVSCGSGAEGRPPVSGGVPRAHPSRGVRAVCVDLGSPIGFFLIRRPQAETLIGMARKDRPLLPGSAPATSSNSCLA